MPLTVDFCRLARAMHFVIRVERFKTGNGGVQHIDPIQADQRGIELIDDLEHFKLADIVHVHDVTPLGI